MNDNRQESVVGIEVISLLHRISTVVRKEQAILWQLCVEPLTTAGVYSAMAVLASLLSLVTDIETALVTSPVGVAASYIFVTRVLSLPTVDRSVSLMRYDDVENIVISNDARAALAGTVSAATIGVAILLPPIVYQPIGAPLYLLLVCGNGIIEAWTLQRLTAQYLPRINPRLTPDEYDPPIDHNSEKD